MNTINFNSREEIQNLELISDIGNMSMVYLYANYFALKLYNESWQLGEVDIEVLSKIRTPNSSFVLPLKKVIIQNSPTICQGYISEYIKGFHWYSMNLNVDIKTIIQKVFLLTEDVLYLTRRYGVDISDLHYKNVLFLDDFTVKIIDMDHYRFVNRNKQSEKQKEMGCLYNLSIVDEVLRECVVKKIIIDYGMPKDGYIKEIFDQALNAENSDSFLGMILKLVAYLNEKYNININTLTELGYYACFGEDIKENHM